jgi:NAD+ synthase
VAMLTRDAIRIDPAVVAARIEAAVRSEVLDVMRRRGAVVALSGGIDSSVVAALCVRALGPDRVLGLLLPERDSSSDALRLATTLADRLGIERIVEDIAPTLAAAGCYARQDEAIRMVVPEFESGWRFKLVLPSLLAGDRLNILRLTVQDPSGAQRTLRLTPDAYLQLVAATNFKQRTRKMLEYYHADRLRYAVAGTPNRLEYDQGFFVKQGDGAADFKPIAHLLKSQVFALAEFLGIPAEIRSRVPTTDTYPMAQSQEEFFFGLPYEQIDLCLWALDHDVAPADAASAAGLSVDEVERVFRDIEAKRRASRYLHHVPTVPIAPGD